MPQMQMVTVGQLIHDGHIVEQGSDEGVLRFIEQDGIKVFIKSQIDNEMAHAYQFEIIAMDDEEGTEPIVVIQLDRMREDPNNYLVNEAFDVEIYSYIPC